MSLLRKNIAANFAGNFWQAGIALLFIPLYIKFIGIASYGLIGIFTTLQAILVLLDLGLTATLTREMARLSALPGKAQEMRDLVRSLEIICWFVAILIGMAILAISPFITHNWINPSGLSPHTIEEAVLIMGLTAALQWPASFYSGGLMGLQQQVVLNIINIVISTLRSVGAVLILWLISPTIQAFFLWQLLISIINTSILTFFLWSRLPHTEKKSSFQKQIFTGIWRFAAGISGISILALILTQLDKIILSKMLTLEMFGYYTLASAVAMTIYRLIGPVYFAIYPRFTQLVAISDQDGLKRLYHKSCQVMSVLIFPVTIVVAIFSKEILQLWTQNTVIAERTYLLVSFLICGTALNGLMYIPYALQLANGWTKLAFYTNLIAVIMMVPMIVYMIWQYGALGAAILWVILNGCCLLIAIHFMHRRLLSSEKWRWYWQDVCLPLLTAIIIAGLGKLFIRNQSSQFMVAFYLIFISISTLGVTAIATQATRLLLFNRGVKSPDEEEAK